MPRFNKGMFGMRTVLLSLALAACTSSSPAEDMGVPTDLAQAPQTDLSHADLHGDVVDLYAPDAAAAADAGTDLAGAVLYYYDWWDFELWFFRTYKEKLCEDDQALTQDAQAFCVSKAHSFLRFGALVGGCGSGGPTYNIYSQVVCY